MSTTQVAASPRAPRAQHASKNNGTASPSNGGRGPRKSRGNRAHNANTAMAQHGGNALQDPSLPQGVVFSSEETAMPVGPRQPKKHTRSQPSADRIFSPTGAHGVSHTDTEVEPGRSHGTPAKAQGAYAGPTFHASPAPSSLPIPKFLSKSVPPKTHTGPPTPPPEGGSDSGSSPSPSPSRGIPIPMSSPSRPLDLLFNADRAERARNVHSVPLAPASSSFPAGGARPELRQHNSFGIAPFPLELESHNQPSQFSPPPANYRSATSPSSFPQMEAHARPSESDPIRELMNKLSVSQNKSSSTPPRTGSSDPAFQHHSPSPFHDGRPSPFRSTSGPTAPTPSTQPQENPALYYGNQNLSSKFQAAITDPAKRNSGLRTEITADSPAVPQGAFPSIPFTNNDPRSLLGDALNGPSGPRRGSSPSIAPIPPYKGIPHNHNTRSPNRRSYQAHPNKQNGNGHGSPAGSPATVQKSTTAMAFIPSSVRAKPPPTPPRKVESDNLVQEANLKRMLNIGPLNTNSVR